MGKYSFEEIEKNQYQVGSELSFQDAPSACKFDEAFTDVAEETPILLTTALAHMRDGEQ